MADLKFKSKIIWGCLLLLLLTSTSLAVNHPPALNPIGSKEVYVGETLTFSLTAADEDGDEIYFSGNNLPVNAILNPKTGLFSWTPEINQLGNYQFTFIALDRGVPRLQTRETIKVRAAYKFVHDQQAWGSGLKETEEIVGTSSIEDLYPKISRMQIDGQEYPPSQTLFYTSKKPRIQVEATSPYNINKESISVLLDGKRIAISPFSKIQTFGKQQNIFSLAFEVALENLSVGRHALVIKMGNELGASTQSIKLSVNMPKLLDAPQASPSPYRPSAGGTATILYTLSQSADIDIHIISPAGEVVKKLSFYKGSEGAKAGMNKASWNGTTDQGVIAGNDIYLVTIINQEDQNILGKLKLAVY
ncbi:MAG: Ig domain-containing protein [Candidatus Margulisiibacteriota bacterium]